MRTASHEFITTCLSIRELADQIAMLAEDHLDADPDDVTWAQVGDAKRLLAALREAVAPFEVRA